MKHLIIIVSISLMPLMSIKAQETASSGFGIRAGMGFSNIMGFSYSGDGIYGINYIPICSYNVGAVYDLKLSRVFYLQPGLNFVSQGANESSFEKNVILRLNYFQLPVMAVVKFPTTRKAQWELNGGLYISLGIGGASTAKQGVASPTQPAFGNKPNSLLLNRFETGTKFGGGVTIGKVFLGITQTIGFGNIAANSIIEAPIQGTISMTNLNTMFNVGYAF